MTPKVDDDERTRTSDDRVPTEGASGAAPALDVGAVLGRYRLVGHVGAGGMGIVYRARDPALDRELAIKVVRTAGGPAAQDRLLREAQAMARLRRPGVVPVFDVGTVGDAVFVVMPYLPGGTLGAWLAAAPRRWRDVLDRFVAAGRGLAVAHAAGLVHRDFKPDNVLLDEHGEVAVADFGLARPVRAASAEHDDEASASPGQIDVTRAGAIVGTPAYMAPEQLRGEAVDARADVFSFCASLYQGLYGDRPFAVTGVTGAAAVPALLEAVASGRIRTPPAGRDVPAWLRDACVRGLAADPDARWPSIDAMLAHLERRRRRPRRAIIALAAALAVTATAIVAIAFAAGRGRREPVHYTARRVTSSGDVRMAALSPDGARVAVVAGDQLRVLGLADPSTARTLASGVADATPMVDLPAWTPDGRAITYENVSVGAEIVSLDGAVELYGEDRFMAAPARGGRTLEYRQSGRRFMIRTPGRAARSCAVPGDYMWMNRLVGASTSDDVFVLASTGGALDRIYRTDVDCRTIERIAPGVVLTSVALAADGASLIAIARRDDRAEVVKLDRTGAVTELDAPLGPHASIVGEEPGGSVLVTDGEQSWRLLRVDRQGKGTELAAGAPEAALALSPDGTRFALIEGSDGVGRLRVGALASPQQLGPVLEAHATALDWSPDGARLATITRDGAASSLVLVDADGAHREVRPLVEGADQADVSWIAPGQIAYRVRGNVAYSVIDLATGARHDLADRTAGWMFELCHGPTGGLVWLWNRRRGGQRIWTSAVDGTSARAVPTGPIDDWLAVSSPGTDVLLFAAASPQVRRLDLDTGAIEPYLTLPQESGASNRQLFALAGGDVLVLRSLSVTDVVRLTPER